MKNTVNFVYFFIFVFGVELQRNWMMLRNYALCTTL